MGSWEDAPSRDVQVLMLYLDPPYREIVHGHDTYLLEGETQVKYGKWMDDDAYVALVMRAMEDMEWPSANHVSA